MVKVILKLFAIFMVAVLGIQLIGYCFNSRNEIMYWWGAVVGLALTITEVYLIKSLINEE